MFEGLREIFQREPRKEASPYEIELGVSFKPYETARSFFWPEKGEKYAIIPETYYPHEIAMRKKVLLYGAKGYLDIISEDPTAWIEMLVRGKTPEKPLGETCFEEIYGGPNDIKYTKMPFILRFGFFLHSPAQYSKLLNSIIDARLGEERYVLTWNINQLGVKENMQNLEDGNETLVVEKNLINLKELNKCEYSTPPNEGDRQEAEAERDMFVWLLKDLKSFQGIQLTFHRIDDWDYLSQPTGPATPLRERISAIV